jgi:hypothetical protein
MQVVFLVAMQVLLNGVVNLIVVVVIRFRVLLQEDHVLVMVVSAFMVVMLAGLWVELLIVLIIVLG